MCNKIIELGKLGKTKVQMAAAIDVSKDTIYAYCHEHKDFSDAMSLAMAYAEDFWSQLGNDGVWDIPGEKKINTGVYTFNMKNRFGWTDKAEIVQAVTSDITIRDVTKEKLKDILNDQLAAVESVPQITGPTGD